MEVEASKSVSLCQIYFPIVIGATHTNFKCFRSELICSVASDYHENNKVKDFRPNFRLGCLSDFKKLPRICMASSKRPIQEFILKKVAGLNPATLLRTEFFCVSFSKAFLELSEDLKAVE